MTNEADGDPNAARRESPSCERAERDELVTKNLGLANYLARQFLHRGEPLEDLQQVASLALVKAADRYDDTREVKFSTFASRTIVGELQRHLRDKSWAVRPPRSTQELALAIPGAVASLSQDLGRTPTVAEIAKTLHRREVDVLIALEASRGYRTTSLDAPSSDGRTMMSRLESRTTPLDDESMTLEQQIAHLAPDDQQLIRLRFVDELPQHVIASRLAVSQIYVSRRLRALLDELRKSS